MTLPEEVRGRLAARAVTDPDVAALLEIFTKSDVTLSERSPEPRADADATRLAAPSRLRA